jgi:hypothetical protein
MSTAHAPKEATPLLAGRDIELNPIGKRVADTRSDYCMLILNQGGASEPAFSQLETRRPAGSHGEEQLEAGVHPSARTARAEGSFRAPSGDQIHPRPAGLSRHVPSRASAQRLASPLT